MAWPTTMPSQHICAMPLNGQGFCSGDSGGPLVMNKHGYSSVIGVVSFHPEDYTLGKTDKYFAPNQLPIESFWSALLA